MCTGTGTLVGTSRSSARTLGYDLRAGKKQRHAKFEVYESIIDGR